MHIIKLKATDVKSVLEEATREHNSKVGTIDETRTHLNYNLAPEWQKVPNANILKERIKAFGVKRKIKDDAVLCCSCIIDIPKDCDVPVKEFMESAYRCLVKELCKGKEEYVIQAEVHMDEKTPHMHFSYVPIVEKDGKVKLSAKEALTKEFLRSFHPDMSKLMSEDLKADIRLYDEEKCRERAEKRSKGDFSQECVSLTEYKATKEKEAKNKELDEEISKGTEILDSMINQFNALKADNEELKKQKEDLKKDLEKQKKAFEEENNALKAEKADLMREIAVYKQEKHTILQEFKKMADELISAIRKLEKSIFWIRDKAPTIASAYEEKGKTLYDKALDAMEKMQTREVKRCTKAIEQLTEEIDDYDMDL